MKGRRRVLSLLTAAATLPAMTNRARLLPLLAAWSPLLAVLGAAVAGGCERDDAGVLGHAAHLPDQLIAVRARQTDVGKDGVRP